MAQVRFNVEDLPEVSFKEGDKVLTQGETSNTVYILKSGSVAISADGAEICRIDDPMSIFGEISALVNVPHTATVSVVSKARFYMIENLDGYITKNPEIANDLTRVLAERLVRMNEKFLEFKRTLDGTFNSDASLKSQMSNLVLCIDSILGRSIFEAKK